MQEAKSPTKELDYAALRHHALAVARRAGYADRAEDFAQQAMTSISNGRKPMLEYLLIDYLRETFGSTNPKRTNPAAREVRAEINSRYASLVVNEDAAPAPRAIMDFEFLDYAEKLTAQERAMMVLRYKWDLSLSEIGEAFGVTESRVCQHMSDLHRKLRKRLKTKGVTA